MYCATLTVQKCEGSMKEGLAHLAGYGRADARVDPTTGEEMGSVH